MLSQRIPASSEQAGRNFIPWSGHVPWISHHDDAPPPTPKVTIASDSRISTSGAGDYGETALCTREVA